MTRFSAVLLCFLALSAGEAGALDQVRFGTNWVAEGEHGGFYQALADGTYKKFGLDVVIVPGGPNTNNRILLPVGKLRFFKGPKFVAVIRRSRKQHSDRRRGGKFP